MTTSHPAGVLKRNNAYFIDPTRICIREGHNPRFDMGDIRQLADQIKAELARNPDSGGLINDLRVKRLKPATETADFELIDGNRRLLAIRLLMEEGVKFPVGVPSKIEAHDVDDLSMLVHTFVANEGKPFNPLEEAIAYDRFRQAGWTLERISAEVGRSVLHIGTTLELLAADESVRDAVGKGEVSASTAKDIAVAAKGDKAKQKELTDKARSAKDKASRAQVKKDIQQAREERNAKKGKVLKPRVLSADDMNVHGSKMQAQLVDILGTLGIDDKELSSRMAQDPTLQAAFTLGALTALKLASGVKVSLTL